VPVVLTLSFVNQNPSGSWTLVIADESPGRFADCVDRINWYYFDQKTGDYYDCFSFADLNVTSCTDLSQVPHSVAFHMVDNLTAVDACCSCPGGGKDVTGVPSTILSWRLIVYGHGGDGAETWSAENEAGANKTVVPEVSVGNTTSSHGTGQSSTPITVPGITSGACKFPLYFASALAIASSFLLSSHQCY
jgi:hypothetical protein